MAQGPILLVDDEPINLGVLEAALHGKYALLTASNGSEAIALALAQRPALVLLDINMPDMDGYTVCRLLKADPRTEAIPVIFVSSLGDSDDETAGFDAGGVDYLTKPISRPILMARVHTHLSLVRTTQLEKSHRDAIHMLGEAGHFNDTDTGVHIWRMATYAGLIAAAYGLPRELCTQIELAAPMHDTGKIGISRSILRKPGKLDPEEWEEMKTHSQIGYNILSKSDAPVFQLAAEVALYHHERWDGCGYPNQLVGAAIPVSARIVALADVFDALTMERPYKPAWPVERVVELVRACSGSHFDPDVVRAFDKVLPEILRLKGQWDRQGR